MKILLFIAAGGSIGAVLRYLVSVTITSLAGRDFPYGTLFVNVTGSLMIGLLSILLLDRFDVGAEWRAAILVGVLGAFTTFSTFSFETLTLIERGEMIAALTNIFMNVILCLLAVWFGMVLGRQI